MKRIAICCDGTWNSPDETADGVNLATNVVKLAEAVKKTGKDKVRQSMYYDPGVGSGGSWLKRCFDGATGTGISRNIKEAYTYLINTYKTGDELFLFGFSRGAYTVRSLAGLIRNSGLLRPDTAHMTDKAYDLYRSGSKSAHPKSKEATLFRRTYALSDIVPIKFIGVWDTVGSLGNPLFLGSYLSRMNRFHDTGLSSTIENAYQALAIDEKRKLFEATLWHQKPGMANQVLEQVWFKGVHSNVGGGYPRTGLSDIALQWLADKAAKHGLDLKPISTSPAPDEEREESWNGMYKAFKPFYRPMGKTYSQGATNEAIHQTVADLYKAGYRPKNLVEYMEAKTKPKIVK
ncbi:DUF2235 domain-containing protein [Salidesulfovibrio onnuriiensis]|uniref:DUF2235 domain-containing protein n=1 Tax=Salidesulfovibrio onnuriiensis TaxID=2583823 RepID=UPI0011CB33D0|nr:DUF2235 domain-containing protein [Salidesulfovibrio onnuriiensis]